MVGLRDRYLQTWLDARWMIKELWRTAQQMMSVYFRDKEEYKAAWNEVFMTQRMWLMLWTTFR